MAILVLNFLRGGPLWWVGSLVWAFTAVQPVTPVHAVRRVRDEEDDEDDGCDCGAKRCVCLARRAS